MLCWGERVKGKSRYPYRGWVHYVEWILAGRSRSAALVSISTPSSHPETQPFSTHPIPSLPHIKASSIPPLAVISPLSSAPSSSIPSSSSASPLLVLLLLLLFCSCSSTRPLHSGTCCCLYRTLLSRCIYHTPSASHTHHTVFSLSTSLGLFDAPTFFTGPPTTIQSTLAYDTKYIPVC